MIQSISWMSVHESRQTPRRNGGKGSRAHLIKENGGVVKGCRVSGTSRNQGFLDSELGYVSMSAHLKLHGFILALWFLCWNGQGLVLPAVMRRCRTLSC